MGSWGSENFENIEIDQVELSEADLKKAKLDQAKLSGTVMPDGRQTTD